jgi:hypothetical protein
MKQPREMAELTHGLSGASGEYYAAAELSRRGFLATITNRNAERIDILAAKPSSGRALKIQVKTIQGDKAKWVLSDKSEAHHGPDFYYIFVRLGSILERPVFHVVPSEVVARSITTGHQKWLSGTKRDGSPRKDGSMRAFRDESGEFKEAWGILEEGGAKSVS